VKNLPRTSWAVLLWSEEKRRKYAETCTMGGGGYEDVKEEAIIKTVKKTRDN